MPKLLEAKLWADPHYPSTGREGRPVEWDIESVTVTRRYSNGWHRLVLEPASLSREGGFALGHAPQSDDGDYAHQEHLEGWFSDHLARGRDILLDLSCHGDLRVAFRVYLGYGLSHSTGVLRNDLGGSITVERWASLDTDEERDAALRTSIIDELRRAVGGEPTTT